MSSKQTFGVAMGEQQGRDEFDESLDLPRMALVSQLSRPGHASHQLQRNYMKNNKVVREEKCRILRNVFILSLVFLLNFTSVRSIQSLQVTGRFMDDKISLIGLLGVFIPLVLACLFLTPLVLTHLGYKWSIVISIIPYVLYMVACLYPIEATIIPTSIFVGLGAAMLWVAKCSYLTEASKQFADWSGDDAEVIINRFFGIFFFIYQTSTIWSSLISGYLVLDISNNATLNQPCGVYYCSDDQEVDSAYFERPNTQTVYAVCGINAGLCFLAMLVAIVFLSDNLRHKGSSLEQYDSLDREDANLRVTTRRQASTHELDGCKASCRLLLSAPSHWRKLNQFLLIPLSIYCGLQQGFFLADYSKSFVACTLSVRMVVWILICQGAAAAIFSFLVGYMANCIKRPYLVAIGGFIHCALLLAIFLWRPDSDFVWAFFTVAALWGLADAIWKTMINAMYACIFMETKDAAFTNYKLWESLGLFLAFGSLHFHMCVYIKLYVLMSMLILGLAGYFIVEKRIQANN